MYRYEYHMCIKYSSGPSVQTFKNFVFRFGKHTKTNTDAVHDCFGLVHIPPNAT